MQVFMERAEDIDFIHALTVDMDVVVIKQLPYISFNTT